MFQNRIVLLLFVVIGGTIFSACDDSKNSTPPGDPSLPMAGGDTTTSDRSSGSFENPSANLDELEAERHLEGDKAFERSFVTEDGLGPVFNHKVCSGCHIRNGRGLPVTGNDGRGSQLLLRASLPPEQGDPEVPGGSVPVPVLGTQLQDHAIYGEDPEITVDIRWEEVPGSYPDGEEYTLRWPYYDISPVKILEFPSDMRISARVPPPVIGRGLLEAITDEDLEALEDPNDVDGDGISGRANIVWNPIVSHEQIGRFGQKAGAATLLQQSGAAYLNDMGIASSAFLGNHTEAEITDEELQAATFYVQSLAVPQRRDYFDETIQEGEELFDTLQCAGCHVPSFTTGNHDEPSLRYQTIYPYTDLLLHDMGEGLADYREEFLADGTEWKTPALWGIGVTVTIMGSDANFLHDGRARSIEEAILWHGGEAEASKQAFMELSSEERAAVLAFLDSL